MRWNALLSRSAKRLRTMVDTEAARLSQSRFFPLPFAFFLFTSKLLSKWVKA